MKPSIVKIAVGMCGIILCVAGAVAGNVAVFAGGVVIIIAAVLGGGLKAFGIEIPLFPRASSADVASQVPTQQSSAHIAYGAHPTIGVRAGRWEPSPAVRHAQSLLGIKADGLFGTETRNSVVVLQKEVGVRADGVVGRDTWPRLHPVLKRGSSGPAVDELQSELRIEIDGVFGRLTATAVKAVQARAGLPTDGIVGPDTWRAVLFDNTTRS